MDPKSPPSAYSSLLFNHSGPLKCLHRNRNPGRLSSFGEEVNPYHLAFTVSTNQHAPEVTIIRLLTTMEFVLPFLLLLSSLSLLSYKPLLILEEAPIIVL